jgi:membrane associated rhomboid family serine protease
MGFQDRDYYRESTRHAFSEWFGERATIGIILATTLVYLLQLATRFNTGTDQIAEYGAFYPPAIFQGQLWRLVTVVFLHDPYNPLHLVFNMFGLYIFGAAIERVYGAREFLGFYFAAALAGGILELLIRGSGLMDDNTPFGRQNGIRIFGVGASGAVSACAVVFACKFPQRPLSVMFLPVFLPAWMVVGGFLLFDAAGVLRPTSRTNHLAHLCGAAFGLVYHFADLRLTGRWPSWPRRQARPRLRLVPRDEEDQITPPQPLTVPPPPLTPPADEQLEAKLDRVLAKVSANGRDSLTAEEQAILQKASEIFRNRRR